jgi:hypothetical protein
MQTVPTDAARSFACWRKQLGNGTTRKMPAQVDCPSAQPTEAGARIFGVVSSEGGTQRIGYLTEALPAAPDIMAWAGRAQPTQVFRMAAPCMNGACQNFAAGQCALAQRIVHAMEPVVSGLPPCQIRKSCRWFHQEGKAACLRCPAVVTDAPMDSAREIWVATGTAEVVVEEGLLF